MRAISSSEFRQNQAAIMDKVVESHIPIIVMHPKGKVVILSLKGFRSYEETMFLLSNPDHSERLVKSIDNAKRGKYKPRELME
ncbi:MAG: type II toxin-antitoxin system prevent-host-death family antitoxin [Gammaproteobacteria bacterium]|nr:type II toxin-antitoxin system prevent-host-death family antitoxin [Gammaproteobacteria bacterium]